YRGVSTWLGESKGQTGIIKVFAAPVDAALQRSLQRSYRRHHGLKVPGVVPPRQLTLTDEGMVLVRAQVQGTPLFDVIRSEQGPEQVALAVALGEKLFRVLADLHREGLVHGHLSPGNVWVDTSGHIQVTDIGTSAAVLVGSLPNALGSLPPVAPEVAAGWGPRAASDVHGAGALMHAALFPSAGDITGRTVPRGLGAAEAPVALASCRPDVATRLSHLLQQTRALDWSRRPTAAKLSWTLASVDRWTRPAPLPPCPLRVGQSAPLEAALDHLQRPGPRLVVLSGPAGCGRHRLADAVARSHLRALCPPIWIEADRAETGSLLIRTLRRLVGPDQHAARRNRLLRGVEGPLASLWPALQTGIPLEPEPNLDAKRVIEAGVTATQRSLADRPALLIFDGLEDADPLSLRWLHRLLHTEADFRIIAICDERWQTDELRRMRTRLQERPTVLDLTLPDLSPHEVRKVVKLLSRSVDSPTVQVFTEPASPARATEEGHKRLAEWRGETRPALAAAATIFGLVERVPTAALRGLGIDPASVIHQQLGMHDHPGWLRRRHEGIQALGRRGMARRSRQADRLAEALESSPCPPDLLARGRLLGEANPRTPVVRAAIAAWNADRPEDARRWIHVADRLPRDRTDPGYRSLRAELARVRAEVAYMHEGSPPRPDLLQQARRRARSPDEQAALPYVLGLAANVGGSRAQALRIWRSGMLDSQAHAIGRARCASALHSALLHQGAVPEAREALESLAEAAREPEKARGPRRWLALARSRTALASGAPEQSSHILQEWLRQHDARPDPEAVTLQAWAMTMHGEHAGARAAVASVLDDTPHHHPARVLHGWLALGRGDTRAAVRAHRVLPPLGNNPPALRLALEMRLASARGEHSSLVEWVGRSAPSRRPDLWCAWMTAVLDVVRTLPEPELRLARQQEAHAAAATQPYPDLQLALAWSALDAGDLEQVSEHGTAAATRAEAVHHTSATLRAQLMLVFAHPAEHNLWSHLVDRASDHPDAQVRHDVGELSARLALLTGDRDVASQWIQFLSGLARDAPDHGLAARATVVHRLVQRSTRGPSTAQ
ncbi:MAG TPA: hypothetical protein DFR83_10400, partial [Deltaproteobacteria bacterium]|nr:hypothetical protein [Deltaproteobacteria bacterium]